jgi:hypothetical protein
VEITTTEKTSDQTLKDKPSFLEVYCELNFFIKECSGVPNSFITSIKVTIEDIQDPIEIMKVIERYRNILEQIKKSYVKEKK